MRTCIPNGAKTMRVAARLAMAAMSAVLLCGTPVLAQDAQRYFATPEDAVRALVDGPLRFDPCPFLEVGMEVEVIRGPLAGVRGQLLRKGRTSRLLVGVNLIRQGVSLDIDAADVRPV